MRKINTIKNAVFWSALSTTVLSTTILFSQQTLARTCPINPTDALANGGPVANVNPSAPAGTPELDIDDVYEFVLDNNITNIKGLLDVMPDHVKSHYALLEKTRALNTASPTQPGVMMYSVDGTFLMNYGVDPAHELYEVIDLAYLQGPDDGDRDGEWRFASIDFNQNPPALVNDTNADSNSACFECHGDPANGKPPLPIWGEYLIWNDVIGDVKGETKEELEAHESVVLKEIKRSQNNHDRYHALKMFDDTEFHYRAGRTFSLPDLYYGYTNTVSSMEIGSAMIKSLHTRMKKNANYHGLREEYILASACASGGGLNSNQESAIKSVLASNGVSLAANEDPHRKHIFQALGLNYEHEMARDKLATDTTPPTRSELDYSLVSDGIYEVINGVILHELAKENEELKSILQSFDVPTAYVPCDQTGWDGFKTLEYRDHQLFTLRGTARQDARRNYFQTGNFRYTQGMFGDEGKQKICNFLKANIGTGTVGNPSGTPPPPNATPVPSPTPIPAPNPTPAPSDNTLANGVAKSLSADRLEESFFTLELPEGATDLKIEIKGGSGDADLYVRRASKPSLTQYDCRPYLSTQIETCEIEPSQAGTYHVMLRAYTDYSDVQLRASYAYNTAGNNNNAGNGSNNGASEVIDACASGLSLKSSLSAGDTICLTDTSNSNQAQMAFYVDDDNAGRAIEIVTDHGTGNGDLYHRYDSRPNTSTWDAISNAAGTSETINVEAAQKGWHYIHFRAVPSFSGVSLRINFL